MQDNIYRKNINNRPTEIQCFDITRSDYGQVQTRPITLENAQPRRKVTKRTVKAIVLDYIESNTEEFVSLVIFSMTAGIVLSLGLLYLCSRL